MGQFLRVFFKQTGTYEVVQRRHLRDDLVTQQLTWSIYQATSDGQVIEEVRHSDFGEPLRFLAGLVDEGWTTVSVTSSSTPYPEWYNCLLWSQK
ncbi:hypothetical protein [Nucisporomicrobium flavum]|uniref:hypothetical protein n=1 Tax=Nucisporomicrobium flavum TaxID=2785915 RepID=UPI0018F69C5E|nr:hypothetical protein [Nucisporomicrobium flavum]